MPLDTKKIDQLIQMIRAVGGEGKLRKYYDHQYSDHLHDDGLTFTISEETIEPDTYHGRIEKSARLRFHSELELNAGLATM